MGWVPFAVEALEHQFQEMLAGKRKKLTRQPWEYFHDHFFCTFWFEKIGPKLLLETIGVDNVMFETDFPHPTSLYPGVQEHLKNVLGATAMRCARRCYRTTQCGCTICHSRDQGSGIRYQVSDLLF